MPRHILKTLLAVASLLLGAALPAHAKQCAKLHPNLTEALEQARQYARIEVTSVCHGRHASGSYHYRTRNGYAMAVDFRARGNVGKVASHFKGYPGGFAHYGGGLLHIDTGPFRRWR